MSKRKMYDPITSTVGDLYLLAQKTNRKNTTDLSARTAFGWTGVPVVISAPWGQYRSLSRELEYEVEYVEATSEHGDYIKLKVVLSK